MSRIRFLVNFLRHPLQVGSVTPSSRWLCRKLVRQAEWERCECAVEFGPGTASLTREILSVLPRGARLFAFEINEDFVRMLREEFAGTGCVIINDSAEKVSDHLRRHGLRRADVVFSGLPFTAMPAALRERILIAARDALREGGKFIVYQYSLFLLKRLRGIFEDVQVRFEPRNIPPAFCFVCTKRGRG